MIFDADGDVQRPDHRTKHERDNKALIMLLGLVETLSPLVTLSALTMLSGLRI